MSEMAKKMSYFTDSSFIVKYTAPWHIQVGTSSLRIDMVGDEQCTAKYHIIRPKAGISVLLRIVEGSATLVVHETVHPLLTGTIVLLPAGETYEYYANEPYGFRLQWFNISGDLYPYLLQSFKLLATPVYLSNQAINKIFDRTMKLCLSSPDDHVDFQLQLFHHVYDILYLLSTQSHSSKKNSDATDLKFFIDNLIIQQQYSSFSISSAADTLRTSPRKLVRSFTKKYQITPYEYYLVKKIELAQQYLVSSSLTISEISNQLGFCDQYYFSNRFKKTVGVSPKQYRILESIKN